MGISKTGLDFNSPDGQLCHIILLTLTSKEEHDKHRKFITLFRAMISSSDIRPKMLDSDNIFSAATTLMTRHVMGQQATVEVIDELEAMFKARYDDLHHDA